MTVDVIADYGDLCGECPVWDEMTSVLHWVDAVGRRLYRYQPGTRQHEIVSEGIEIYGFRRNRKGGFVITNPSGIWLWSAGGRPQLLAADVDGVKCQMNDCTTDSYGRVYAGTTYFDAAAAYKPGHLLRVDNNGAVTILDEGFHLSNGIAFSPQLHGLDRPADFRMLCSQFGGALYMARPGVQGRAMPMAGIVMPR